MLPVNSCRSGMPALLIRHARNAADVIELP
jgi:hypothetical protein